MIPEPPILASVPLTCGSAQVSAPAADACDSPCSPAPAASPPVPSLSPSDRTLLFAYFENHDNLAALATTTGQDYFDLLTWLNQPHIQQALELHDQAVARADRRRALDALRQSLDTADNPTNLRRAATTLLRSTIAARDRKPDREGGRPARNPSNGAHVSSASHPTHSPPSPPPLHHPLPPLSTLPPPTSRPTPNADPKTAFAQIAAALTAPQLPIALSTLHAHAAFPPPEAAPADSSPSVASSLRRSVAAFSPTFAGHPIPTDPAAWPESLPTTLPKDFTLPLSLQEPPREVERTETHSRWILWTRGRCTKSFECAITLTRASVNPDREGGARDGAPDGCWRLAAFDILRQSG